MVRKFEAGKGRGHFGYLKAAWKSIWDNPVMNLELKTDTGSVFRSAAMVEIANATQYGTGALINPNGKSNLFEIVIVKKISVLEIFKMMVSHRSFDPAQTGVIQISAVEIHSKRNVHFQVNGEYLNKVSDVHAVIVPNALKLIKSAGPISTIQRNN